MVFKLASISASDIGPVLPAMSLVPARMTTTLGSQVDDVGAEANQHLGRSLSADAAIDVGLAGEGLVELPDVGDGVAHEDDAVLTRLTAARAWRWRRDSGPGCQSRSSRA